MHRNRLYLGQDSPDSSEHGSEVGTTELVPTCPGSEVSWTLVRSEVSVIRFTYLICNSMMNIKIILYILFS